MRYRVSELASTAGVSIDTVRFYQGQGLLSAPEREGRIVWYEDTHLARLARIRSLSTAGFTLRQIGELIDREPDPLLAALADVASGSTIALADLAADSGVAPEILILGVESGLLRAEQVGDTLRFDSTQVEMVMTVARLLDSGVDVEGLIRLATRHADATEEVVAEAVDLYRAAVLSEPETDRRKVASEIEMLVPAVTELVAAHFTRTLVERAAAVLADVDEEGEQETLVEHVPGSQRDKR
jgi:DNA-binding transcriptional MerR regulator